MRFNYPKKDVYYDQIHHKHRTGKHRNLTVLIPLLFALHSVNVTEVQADTRIFTKSTFNNGLQQNTLTGKITDENGNPIKGATIRIENTSIQAESASDGSFSIPSTGITPNQKIVITSIGYQSRTMTVGNTRNFQITLSSNQTDLEEVVIVGYGTQKKENLTGAVDVLSGKALADRPANNIADLIKGASPNMNINIGMRGGEPGSASSWNVRGVGSINGSSSPLILVDGVEMDINTLDPESVASVSILKDASAAAVYGSRAPFGVVLITTKKGEKSDGANIAYSNNLSTSKALNLPSFIDSYTWATAYNQAAANAGVTAIYSAEQMERIKGYLDGTFEHEYDPNNPIANVFHGRRNGNANYDWPQILMGNSPFSQKHNVNVSGGSERTQYYISGGYSKQNGTYAFGYDFYKRYNFISNISTQVTDWLKLNSSIKYANSATDFPMGETTVGREHTFREMQTFAPMMPYYNINGTVQSPLVRLLESSGRDKANHGDFLASLGGEFEPVKGWKTIVNYNYNSKNSKFSANPKPVMVELGNGAFGNIGKPNSSLTTGFAEEVYKLFNAVTSYEQNINEHYFKVMLGYEQEERKYSGLNATGTGLIADEVPSLSTSLGEITTSDRLWHWATRGAFGRLNYNYQEKYLIELSGRYNGSSKFPKKNRFGFFPSGSIGYTISKENYFEPLRQYVNNLKVRASYGSLGNQNVDNYLFLSRINVNPDLDWIINNTRPQYALVPSLISDDITWETISTTNFGVDAAFLNSKLGFTFDWYKRITDKMLGPTITLPYVLGAATPYSNNAKLSTKGYEMVVTWNESLNENFSYNLRMSLGDSQSEILEYMNQNGRIDEWYKGKKYGEIWGLTTDGIMQTDGESMPDQSRYFAKWGAGDMKYKDLNGDGKVNDGQRLLTDHGDLTIIGNTSPRYNIGVSAGFKWKNLDFNMFWQGILKQDFHPDNGSSLFWGMNSAWQNSGLYKHSPGLDYWRASEETNLLGPNTNSYFAKPYFTVETLKNREIQTKYLLNAGYFRMKNIQMGYTIPASLVGKYLSNARVYFSGENLLTFTKLPKVFDPETALASDPTKGGYLASGVIYPTNRILSFGLNITLK